MCWCWTLPKTVAAEQRSRVRSELKRPRCWIRETGRLQLAVRSVIFSRCVSEIETCCFSFRGAWSKTEATLYEAIRAILTCHTIVPSLDSLLHSCTETRPSRSLLSPIPLLNIYHSPIRHVYTGWRQADYLCLFHKHQHHPTASSTTYIKYMQLDEKIKSMFLNLSQSLI